MTASAGTPMTFAAAVAGNLPTAFRNKYARDILLALQAKTTKLRDTVTIIPDAGGEKFIYDFLKGWELDLVETRNDDTTYSEEEMTRRETSWKKYAKAYPVDETDPIALMLDPKWAIKENHIRAARRRVDKTIYTASFATVTTGHDSDGSEAWSSDDSDCKIVAHGSKGLSKEKILDGKAYLEEGDVDVDEGEITLVCHSDDVNGMLRNDETLLSSDYMKVKALADGHIDELWGVKIKKVNHVFTGQTTYRRCAMYAKQGIAYGEPLPPVIKVWENPAKHGRIELYCRIVCGALRLYKRAVCEVQCSIATKASRAKAS